MDWDGCFNHLHVHLQHPREKNKHVGLTTPCCPFSFSSSTSGSSFYLALQNQSTYPPTLETNQSLPSITTPNPRATTAGLSTPTIPSEIGACDGCTKRVWGSGYSCNQCHFKLHKSCAEQRRELKHPLHPKHALILCQEVWWQQWRTMGLQLPLFSL